ncbi:hypothetical protein VNI00_014702 [Paramarasmius palmivorus]|uniref:F-box domain-containing protein n=1 Tax=Paramarasmius palmivorus TaxID=297713 RepID=A0AAW0BQJ4_9AGAR
MDEPALVSDGRLSSLKDLFDQTITEADRRIITQYLLEVEKDVDAYEKELKRLRLSIIAVETKRNRSKKTMEEYKSLLAPIHKVPPEILCSIFEFCCEQNVLQPTSLPPVMALSYVCRRFRSLCLSTPSLWSSFAIPFHTWTKLESLYLVVTTFVAYSNQHPLRLSLDFQNFDRQLLTNQLTHGGMLRNILSMLVVNSQRWEALELHIRVADLEFDVFRPIEGCLPMLEVLRLLQPRAAVELDNELSLFRDCPALHTVSISGLRYWPHLVLPLQGAKSVELQHCFTRDALSHLHSCRNMERLELFGVMRDLDGFEGPETLISNVKSLSIRAVDPDELGYILHHSTLPHLSAITIIGDASLSNFSVDPHHILPLKQCLLRSSCTITSFHMKDLPITDGEALSLLGLMPTLEILGVEEVVPQNNPSTNGTKHILTSSFLQHLAIMDHDTRIRTPFLPQLKDLSLTVHGEVPLDTEALLHAIAARGLHHREVGVAPLTSFDFAVTGNCQKSFDDLMQALLYFNGTGLRVKASYKSL